MPDVTPAGPLSVAKDALRTLIANVPAFQTWTGTANATAALARIFTGEVGWPMLSATIAAGVLTVTTRQPHSVSVADVITLEGAALGTESVLDVSGTYTVTAVTSTTIAMSTNQADESVQFPDGAFVLPTVRPFALVCEDDRGLKSQSVSSGGANIKQGRLQILLEADVPAQYVNDAKNALYQAANDYGNFMDGLMSTQATGDLMWLNECEPISGPDFIADAEQNNTAQRFERWRALMRVSWGIEN